MQSAPCIQHCTTSTLSHHVNPMFVLALPLTEPPALPWTWESRTIFDRHSLQLRQAHRTSSRVAALERGTVVGGAPLTGDPPSGRRHQRDFAPDVEYHMQAAAPAGWPHIERVVNMANRCDRHQIAFWVLDERHQTEGASRQLVSILRQVCLGAPCRYLRDSFLALCLALQELALGWR